jgi:hypothetical protein
MTDDSKTPPPIDPPAPDPNLPDPSNPFADLQAELNNIALDGVGAPGQPHADPLPPAGAPGPVRPQPRDAISPMANSPASSVAISAAQPMGVPGKLRLCPGCNSVQEFVDERCLHCGYQIDGSTPHGAEAAYEIGQAYGSQRSPMFWIALTLLALALLVVAGWFAYPVLMDQKRTTTDANTNTAAAVAQQDAAAEAAIALKPVVVDDALKARITSAFRAGNKAWGGAGTKAYVYRFSVNEVSEAMKSQVLTVTGYTAGQEAALATTDKAAPMMTAFQGLLGELGQSPGVTAGLELEVGSVTDDKIGATYVVYGTDFGRDHMDELQQVIDSVENYKNAEGQYPLALDRTVTASVRTKGNPNFIAGGYGYIPIFKTDGSGNVLMGTGAGVKRLMPAEVTGYYLLRFLAKPTEGLDVYSQADLNYYTQKISPFPYNPNGKVRNMPLTKDGKPDGVACVVKNGKVL